MRPFQDDHIDCAWRIVAEALEQDGLPPVGAEVTRVKQPSAACFEKKPVSVECTVIDEIGSDRERSDIKPLPVAQKARRLEPCARGREECGGLKDRCSLASGIDRYRMLDLLHEPVVVQMRVRQHDADQRSGVAPVEPLDRRQFDLV